MDESAEARKPRILLGVSGGVAAYKAAELVRALQQHGLDVRVAMTRAAQEFVRPLTFSSLTGHKVITGMWEPDAANPPTGLDDEGGIEHISAAQSASAIVIAPATAHILARMAHGLADDFLTTTLLAATCPVIVAPAMNVNMWNHPATQANVETLRTRGVRIVAPGSGYLACGMTGSGRLAEMDSIVQAVLAALTPPDLAGETVLITAGGTREAIDPVRFLGNRSSGKMGYALAEAARRRGAQVILVSAPAALAPPAGCTLVPVVSAAEMHAAVLHHLPAASLVIGAAAVADFRLPAVASQKLHRDGPLRLDLEPTEDILRAVSAARRPGTLVIAFAAETEAGLDRARRKLAAKGADAIVLNDVSQPGIGFESDANAATFITRDSSTELPVMPKADLAHRILDRIVALRLATPTTSSAEAART